MADVTGRDVDKGWAWVVLPAAALSLTLEQAFQACVGIFQVEFLETFSGSQGFVAFIGAVCICGPMVLAPVSGMLSDLLSHRVVAMAGGALRSVALLSASFSPDLSTLLVLFGVLCGVGGGLCYTPCVTMVSTYFHKYRTIANGLTLASLGVGFLVGPYLLHWLIDSYGWRYAMGAYAGLMAQTCVLAAVFFPRIPPSLTSVRCCRPGRGLPLSIEDPALKTSVTTNETDISSPPNDDRRRTEQGRELTSTTTPEVRTGTEADMEILLGSKMGLNIMQGSEVDLVTAARSRTNLEVRCGSKTEVEADAGSRTGHPEGKAGSRIGLQSGSLSSMIVGEFGSVVRLDHSEETLKEQKLEFTPLSFRRRVVQLLCQKFIWVICLNQLLVMSAHAINVVLYAAFARSAGAAFKDIPSLYTVYGMTISLGRVAGAFVFSAIPERLIQVLLGVQMALAVVFAFLPVYGVSLPALYVGVVMVGVTYGPSYLLVNLIIIRYVNLPDLPTAFGLVTLFVGIGFVLAPTLAGITYDIFQSYSVSYYIAGSTVGAGTLPLLLLLFVKDLQPPKVKDNQDSKLLSTNQKACDGLISQDTEYDTANENA